MRRPRAKGYWAKRSEDFGSGAEAQARAGRLRSHEHVAHVKVAKESDRYVVSYSVAGWYLEELSQAGGKL